MFHLLMPSLGMGPAEPRVWMEMRTNCSVPLSEGIDELHREVLNVRTLKLHWRFIQKSIQLPKSVPTLDPKNLNDFLPSYFIFHPSASHSALQTTQREMWMPLSPPSRWKVILFLQHSSVLLCWEWKKKRDTHLSELQGQPGLQHLLLLAGVFPAHQS